ncbi:MAG: ArsR/SmtB family transcription factor [Solirubrobacteraceae bacterium]|jgi:DNA-binding transcriptional ArsR family regulator
MDPGPVFAALADPTRRAILERVASSGDATPTALAAELPVTRQAVAKHLAALEGAGLVAGRRVGREHRYAPRPAPLAEAAQWMARVGGEWDERLARLGRAATTRR